VSVVGAGLWRAWDQHLEGAFLVHVMLGEQQGDGLPDGLVRTESLDDLSIGVEHGLPLYVAPSRAYARVRGRF
jgi:hypothetical protein